MQKSKKDLTKTLKVEKTQTVIPVQSL
mgnify:CR=1